MFRHTGVTGSASSARVGDGWRWWEMVLPLQGAWNPSLTPQVPSPIPQLISVEGEQLPF